MATTSTASVAKPPATTKLPTVTRPPTHTRQTTGSEPVAVLLVEEDDPRTKEEKKADEKAAAANAKRYPDRPYAEAITPAHRKRLEAKGIVVEEF